MSFVPNMRGALNFALYDTNTFAVGNTSTETTYYTTPFGQGGKNKLATNLNRAQQISNNGQFNLQRHGFYVQSNIGNADLHNLLNSAYFEVWLGDRICDEGRIFMAQSGYGVYGWGTVAATGGITLGVPNGKDLNMRELRLPQGVAGADGNEGVFLGENTNFQVKVIIPTAFAVVGAFFLCHIFEGQLLRPVQG